MKNALLRWTVIPVLLVLMSFTKPVDKHHFLIYGNVIELNTDEMTEVDVSGTQIIVYQDNEIYVAFDTNDKGNYEFNLPNGHYYKIQYGTRGYVPKSIEVDARDVYEKRDGHTMRLNVAVFKPIENIDYSVMEEPMSKFVFEYDQRGFEIDFEYAKSKMDEMRDLYKEMKKAKKKNLKE